MNFVKRLLVERGIKDEIEISRRIKILKKVKILLLLVLDLFAEL